MKVTNMKKKKNNYFVPIDTDFLFNKNNIFKSRYTPWIYLYLKLEYNYYIQKLPNKTISLKTDTIAEFFNIDRSTVHRVVNELVVHGLLNRKERNSYVLYSERGKYSDEYENNYLKVFKNLLISIFQNGATIDDAAVYYYMIQNNRHYAFDFNYLESDLTQTKISKALHFDSRKTKGILAKLLKLGLLQLDEESGSYYTAYSQDEAIKIKGADDATEVEADQSINIDVKNKKERTLDDYIRNMEEKVGDLPIHSWFKTFNGQAELPVINIPGYGNICDQSRVRIADGLSPTKEQWDTQNKIITDNLEDMMCVCN